MQAFQVSYQQHLQTLNFFNIKQETSEDSFLFLSNKVKFSKWTIIPLTGNSKNMGAKLRIFWIG